MDRHPIVSPAHAYVPGKTKRHPDGWFDAIRASVTIELDANALAFTNAWRTGLAYFDDGYFWEAHEVLEPVWQQAPPNSIERKFVQALIQLSNARLKLRMGRPKATIRLCEAVDLLLAECEKPGRDNVMGLAPGRVREWLNDTRKSANLVINIAS